MTEESKQELLSKLFSGNCILFTGSGFSYGATNINNTSPIQANGLSRSIYNLIDIDKQKELESYKDDLMFISDYYLSEINDKNKLIEMLKNQFALKETSDSHKTICSLTWRRFYTTNYDHSIEIASKQSNKQVDSFNLDDNTNDITNYCYCLHINGSIEKLTHENINNSFRLTSSSYVSAEPFKNSSWYYMFKKDLECCDAIFFVGYSLYDIEIEQALLENLVENKKIYFVTSDSVDFKSRFIFSKYGQILTVGVDGFADIINSNRNKYELEMSEIRYKLFYKYDRHKNYSEISDRSVFNFLLFGHRADDYIANVIHGTSTKHCAVIRKELLEKIDDDITNTNYHILVDSALGNGKSVLLDELKEYLCHKYNIFLPYDADGDFISDINKMNGLQNKSIIFLDGLNHYKEIIKYFKDYPIQNVKIISSVRTSELDKLSLDAKELEMFINVNIDYLNDSEKVEFSKIIDNIGQWGKTANLSTQAKIRTVNKNKSYAEFEISNALLEIFKSPQIQNRIRKELEPLLTDKLIKDNIFIISFLSIIDVPLSLSIISDMIGKSDIFSNLQKNTHFKNIFNFSHKTISAKSVIFSFFIIKEVLSPTYVIDKLLEIAEKYEKYGNYGKDNNMDPRQRIFRSILKFSLVESLLSDRGKKDNLEEYYDKLKTKAKWIVNDPHYWLQYGMVKITFMEYQIAQKFFDTAYSIAEKKITYDTTSIDTQQARLHLLIGGSISEASSAEVYEYFKKAHTLLNGVKDDRYKYRQVEGYLDYYYSAYNNLNKNHKSEFEKSCKNMLKHINRLGESKFLLLAKDNLEKIITNIKDLRG